MHDNHVPSTPPRTAAARLRRCRSAVIVLLIASLIAGFNPNALAQEDDRKPVIVQGEKARQIHLDSWKNDPQLLAEMNADLRRMGWRPTDDYMVIQSPEAFHFVEAAFGRREQWSADCFRVTISSWDTGVETLAGGTVEFYNTCTGEVVNFGNREDPYQTSDGTSVWQKIYRVRYRDGTTKPVGAEWPRSLPMLRSASVGAGAGQLSTECKEYRSCFRPCIQSSYNSAISRGMYVAGTSAVACAAATKKSAGVGIALAKYLGCTIFTISMGSFVAFSQQYQSGLNTCNSQCGVNPC
jgi:hypothetical protein